MINIEIPFKGRDCNCCHSNDNVIEYIFRSDFGNRGNCVALCKECRIKLHELLDNELTVEQHKLQKPLTLEEFIESVGTPVWFESHGTFRGRKGWWMIPRRIEDADRIKIVYYVDEMWPQSPFLGLDGYNEAWRAWATKPTDEERAAAAWKE